MVNVCWAVYVTAPGAVGRASLVRSGRELREKQICYLPSVPAGLLSQGTACAYAAWWPQGTGLPVI